MKQEPIVPVEIITRKALTTREFDFTKQIHVISQPFVIKENQDNGGKILIYKPSYQLQTL